MRTSSRRARTRALGLVLTMLLVLAACGDDDGTTAADGETQPTGAPATTASEGTATTSGDGGSPLGEPNPASGEPVKIGLITDGGDCSECTETAGDEQPAAEATVQWVNEYMGGVAGHPIELEVCVDDLDPAKATDCANEMIANGVAAVVIGASGVIETSWGVLHDAGIPVFNFSATNEAILQDDQSTFLFQDPVGTTVDFPLGVAQDLGAEVASIIVVDLPIATEIYGGDTPAKFEAAGVELDVIPVPLGVPDMTPQAQQLVTRNPDGLVMIVGHDAFCIPAIEALQSVGFSGTIATISHCVTDAMRGTISGDVLEGMLLAASAPLGDEDDPSLQQYEAVLDTYSDGSVDPTGGAAIAVFSTLGALSLGTQHLEGPVTPDSVIEAMRTMDNEILPGSGGRYFRCNGKASEAGAAVCSKSLLAATLDAEGFPVSYDVINNEPIPD